MPTTSACFSYSAGELPGQREGKTGTACYSYSYPSMCFSCPDDVPWGTRREAVPPAMTGLRECHSEAASATDQEA
jgi:hypothetical protein